jgi:hypothetical protein
LIPDLTALTPSVEVALNTCILSVGGRSHRCVNGLV